MRHFTNVTVIQAGQESAALSLTAQALTIALVKASVLLVIRVSATRDSKVQTVAKEQSAPSLETVMETVCVHRRNMEAVLLAGQRFN